MLRVYNSLGREVQVFNSVIENNVSIYSCGPTVYDYQHIGNLRTATLSDFIKRYLKYKGYNVKLVMNITDVEDKIESKAKKENTTTTKITNKYKGIYLEHLALMNISADIYPHASENISEQLELIKILMEKGFTYTNELGIYFDISKDKNYGELGNTFKSDKNKSRIGFIEGKHNQEDFALWKFQIKGEKRQMLWESPWGSGFPGWHIECSAMSIKYLTHALEENNLDLHKYHTIDIHTGGEDLKDVHHENEIAQSESATGKPFVKYWIHGAMLNIGGDKMSKSLGNFFTLKEIIDRNYDPIILRYLYYNTHYRKVLTFTWEGLDAAKNAYERILNFLKLWIIDINNVRNITFNVDQSFKEKFINALDDDLNFPQALSILWDVTKSNLPSFIKLGTILDFDRVLGLNLEERISNPKKIEISLEAKDLMNQRNIARLNKDFKKADEIRIVLKEKYSLNIVD